MAIVPHIYLAAKVRNVSSVDAEKSVIGIGIDCGGLTHRFSLPLEDAQFLGEALLESLERYRAVSGSQSDKSSEMPSDEGSPEAGHVQ